MAIVINTPPDNVAFSIALGVLLLSVVLQPIVEACLQRIRADRAWKAIENQKSVDVTKYNIFSEAVGDRGTWDTARVITLMLGAFHVSTWVLELSLDLAHNTDGPVDLLNRPPPVVLRADPTHNLTDWIVYPHEQPREGGILNNFHGELDEGNATASYRIGDRFVRGSRLFASWSKEPAQIESGLFYDRDNGRATVEGLDCSELYRKSALYVGTVFDATRKWGCVTECEGGPKLSEDDPNVPTSPPTIILNSTEGVVHMIVEEESSYPGFLYSVWTPGEVTAEITYLDHVFYVSSTTRLAEAIVSGVVNGILTGGGCVDLLSKFSISNTTYDLGDAQRASPFGERPLSSSVKSLDQVESIVAGVVVSDLGSVCGVLIMLVSGSALFGCLCCRSSRTLDVYNRDKLIRAVSVPSGEGADGKPVALRIYVRRNDSEAISIVISDDGVYRGCVGLRKRVMSRVNRRSAHVAPRSLDRTVSRTGSLPAGCLEITCDGIRPTFEGRPPALRDIQSSTPARNDAPAHRTPVVMELIASPVPGPTLPGHAPRGLDFFSLNRDDSSSPDVGPDLPGVEPQRCATHHDSRTPLSLKAPLSSKKKPPSADVEAQVAPAAE